MLMTYLPNKKNKCNPSVNYIKNRALNIRHYDRNTEYLRSHYNG